MHLRKLQMSDKAGQASRNAMERSYAAAFQQGRDFRAEVRKLLSGIMPASTSSAGEEARIADAVKHLQALCMHGGASRSGRRACLRFLHAAYGGVSSAFVLRASMQVHLVVDALHYAGDADSIVEACSTLTLVVNSAPGTLPAVVATGAIPLVVAAVLSGMLLSCRAGSMPRACKYCV